MRCSGVFQNILLHKYFGSLNIFLCNEPTYHIYLFYFYSTLKHILHTKYKETLKMETSMSSKHKKIRII